MKKSTLFEPPVVTVIDLRMSEPILIASFRGYVETEGQEYDEYDFSDEDWYIRS